MKTTLLRPFFLAACAVSALAFAGCAEGPRTPVGNPDSPETAGAPAVLLDDDLQDVIAVDSMRIGHNENGFLAVNAKIRNRTGHDVEVQVQTVFYDRYSQALYSEPGNQTPWTTVVLTSNETQAYRSQALSKAATRLTVRIRYLHRNR